jgi:hypothetical protein
MAGVMLMRNLKERIDHTGEIQKQALINMRWICHAVEIEKWSMVTIQRGIKGREVGTDNGGIVGGMSVSGTAEDTTMEGMQLKGNTENGKMMEESIRRGALIELIMITEERRRRVKFRSKDGWRIGTSKPN